jgi:LuxR family maltose regulon positive regulatory protein
MTIPILTTKLHIPPSPQTQVPRPHLTARLDAGSHGRLILVSAPAGFGKTALLAEWANNRSEKTLFSWLHLDESDNELVRFLRYLIAALSSHQKNIGEAVLSGLESIPPVPVEAALTSLINEIDTFEGKVILVLDDYQLIDTTAIHQAITFLIEYMPAHMCLVIATRTDPPLPLHRLRGRSQMTEFRAEDLRFNEIETRRLLEGMLGTPLSDVEVATLDRRLEGWVAGIQMVALSIQGQEDAHEFIERFSGSHRFIMDYLSEEIYNRQSSQIQKFLLGTSILNRLSGSLCDAVLSEGIWQQVELGEIHPAQEILESLERANLFLHPLDGERRWYRYHRLFANLLRQRLRQTWPEEIQGLQRRASDWFTAHGFCDEAFQYALAAGDYQVAAGIVESQGLEMLKKGSLATILYWLNQLPDQILKERPRLNVIYAWALLLTAQQVNVEVYLTAAEAVEVVPGDMDELRGEIAAIRAYAASQREDIDLTLEQARLALKLLPKDDFSVRSVVSFVLGGVNYLRGDMARAYDAMREASQNGEKSGNIHVAVSALNVMAGIQTSQGKLTEAKEIYARALKLGTGPGGRPLPITASIYGGLARLHLALMDPQNARQYARTGLELGEQWFNADSQIGCLLVLAQVAQLEGNDPECQVALKQARQLAATHVLTPGTESLIENVESMIQAKNGGSKIQGILIEPLSERELEVLKLMSKGHSNAEIADELIIALGTVKAHTSTIYRKLDVRGRTQAVVRAQELGLINIDIS